MANGTPLGNMVIRLGLDSTQMEHSLTQAKNQLRSFDQQVRSQGNLARFYQKGEHAAAAYAKQSQTLTKAIETQSQVLLKRKQAYDEEVAANGALSKRAQSLAREIEQGNGKLADYGMQLRSVTERHYLATSGLNSFSSGLRGVGKQLNGLSNGFDSLSQKTAGLSLAIFGGMYYSSKAAMEYESAFAGVKKTVDEVYDNNGKLVYSYEMLSDGIRKMALELPSSTTEIAKVAETAGQLGIATTDILKFTDVMVDLGETTNLSAEEAATALAKFANITQLDPSKYDRLGSVIVDLGNNMATTEKDITDMGLRLAATGKLVGLTEAQIMGLSASLSSLGMRSDAGGSAMSRVLQKINTAVGEGGEKLQGFANLAGKSAEDFAKSWKESPSEAIVSLVNGLGRVKSSGEDVTKALRELGINIYLIRELLT